MKLKRFRLDEEPSLVDKLIHHVTFSFSMEHYFDMFAKEVIYY